MTNINALFFFPLFFPFFLFFFYIHIVNIVDRSYDGPIYTDFSFGTEKRIFLLLLEKKRVMVILRLFWRRGSVRIRTTPSFSSVAGVCEGILLGKLRG